MSAKRFPDFKGDFYRAPPTGIEPVHPPPEGGALSPELRGLKGCNRAKVISGCALAVKLSDL